MVTLDRLVNVLGGYGVRLRFCPISRSTQLAGVVIHEAVDGQTVVGDVLLAIGARSVDEAVRWAASARACTSPCSQARRACAMEPLRSGSARAWAGRFMRGVRARGRRCPSLRAPIVSF